MNDEQECWFDHERLEVYQEAVRFVCWTSQRVGRLGRLGDVKDQLDRAANSIALNTAEGNGKWTLRDRCRFFDTARGSALECAAALDLLVAKGKLGREDIRPGKQQLQRIVRMLMGLIKKNSSRSYNVRRAAVNPDLDPDPHDMP